jgi:Tfp pilus assembly protein PilF
MPTHIGTWHDLVWVQLLQGDLAAAEESFRRAVELDRNFSERHGGLAVVAAYKGNWAGAEELSKTALGLDPQSVSGRYAQSLYCSAPDGARLRNN